MNLAQLMALRPVPAAGLLISLTERCPLSCAHCSTSSTTVGRDTDTPNLLRFVQSFGTADRPQVLMLTGGEPLLRPGLVAELAATARLAGTRTALLSGMFFARRPAVPAPIRAAITQLDHFSASLDAFHEPEIPRADVFRALRWVLDAGVPVSLHLTDCGEQTGYLNEVVRDVRRLFGDTVPMLVNDLRPVGRAAAWAAPATHVPAPDGRPLPCAMAAWPVIASDGTVLACCNQDTVDRRPVPAHLLLGHLDEDDWPAIRERCRTLPVLRMLRALGPANLYARHDGGPPGVGYCESCHRLDGCPDVLLAAHRDGASGVGDLLDLYAAEAQLAAGPTALVRRFGSRRHAELVDAAAPMTPGQKADL